MKLNEIKPAKGSTKNRKRIARGIGSGKGKTGGRGGKGQTARSGVAINGFEGGQMPLHMRMPKRGFNNPFRKEFAEVNLWRLAQAIEAGKLDPKKAIDGDVLVAAGVIRRKKDGVRLLGKGELKAAIQLTVYSASESAIKAIEAAFWCTGNEIVKISHKHPPAVFRTTFDFGLTSFIRRI